MDRIDLISILGLIIGFILAVVTYFLLKQKKIKAKALPHILAIGGFAFMFISGMIESLLNRPLSEFVSYTIENLFWSLAIGIVAYISGRKLAQKFPEMR